MIVQQTSTQRPRLRGMAKRLATIVGLTTAMAGATLALSGSPAMASWQAAHIVNDSGVNVRSCASTACKPPIGWVDAGTQVHVVCQTGGENIYGNAIWDYIVYPGGEGYAADYYVYTGWPGWIPGVDRC